MTNYPVHHRLLGATLALGVLLTLGTGCARIGHSNPTDGFSSSPTALDAYVATPDPAYGYSVVETRPGEGYTTFVLHMTSQHWLTTDEVDRTLWEHFLLVTVPEQVDTHTAFLFITGGSNGQETERYRSNFEAMAVQSRAITAQLHHVPNQPLTFAGAEPRWEDALIAWGWDQYLRGGREEWLARFPMTKAAVRAMDTVQSFAAASEAGGNRVRNFVVAGGSKRGWTTWTTAAVDNRVVGIVPIVIDMLNMEPSFVHHWRALGFWAPAVGDYERMGTMEWWGHPRARALNALVEPYEYRDRYTMPKLIINATGDQFFLPDSSQFYWDQLPNPKYLRYIPNADHGLGGTNAPESIQSFFEAVAYGHRLPRYDWRIEEDGTVYVRTDRQPLAARLWQVENPEARDFRLEVTGPAWRSERLIPVRAGEYRGRVLPPEEGWRAFFLELEFEGEGNGNHFFTTEVVVIPDVYPFEYHPPVWPMTPEAVEEAAAR